ncbi:MAG: 5-deoxy-glucuronate isomerase [Actinomycetota bacterium]
MREPLSERSSPDLFRPAGTLAEGPDPVALTPEGAGWGFSALRVVALSPGEDRAIALEGFEAAVLPLSGSCRVEVGSHSFELDGRRDVFSRVSDFAYLPAGSEARISSSTGGEFALPSARATRRLEPVYVPAGAVRVEVRGGGVATRQVNNFMSADAFEAEKLIAVEVLTPEGNWSSFPPHKHDEHSEREVPLEEIYYFRIRGAAGFGFHRTYTLDGMIDATVTVRDGDVFLIPRGYHGPCIAMPGHPMYYLNVMAGPAERAWRVCLDPAHEWLAELLGAVGPDPRCPMTTADGPRLRDA